MPLYTNRKYTLSKTGMLTDYLHEQEVCTQPNRRDYTFAVQAMKEEQEHLMKLHKLSQRLATQQDIALTMINPLKQYLTQVIE